MSKLEGDGLPPEQCLSPDGHATDAALACIADGEVTIVPAAALAHVEDCEACGRRLGAAALLSSACSQALVGLEAEERQVSALAVRDAGPHPAVLAGAHAPSPIASVASVASERVAPRRMRRPLPVAAIVVALILVLVTAGPAIAGAIGAVPSLIARAVTTLPFVVRIGSALLRGSPWGDGGSALAIKMVSAVFFVLAGLSVARRFERAGTVRGGVG
jgi:hypothetical protein